MGKLPMRSLRISGLCASGVACTMLKHGLSLFHVGFEGVELGLADALNGEI